MILYYSASGNSEYIAKLLAEQLEDECLDLTERIKKHDYAKVISQKPFIVCSPVYICDMPCFLREYIKRLPFRGCREIYYVFTDAGYAGSAGDSAEKLTKRKDMFFKGWAEVKMPSNHVVSKKHEPKTPEECIRLIKEATAEAGRIGEKISQGCTLKSRHVLMVEKAVALPFAMMRSKQSTKGFHATDKCLACGKCTKVCPMNNIRIENGKPVWESPCAHCMACILNCPRDAVEYGEITQGRNKYHIRKYLDKLSDTEE